MSSVSRDFILTTTTTIIIVESALSGVDKFQAPGCPGS
jgi:hypothetical protein